jgi:LacI family transcriptional regulator
MDTLGYVYHRGAATLRTQKSAVVGLLITDVSNPFFSAMAQSFERALWDTGYLTVLTNTFDESDRFDEITRSMFEYPVAALVYVPVAGADLSFATSGASTILPSLAVTRDPGCDAPFLGPDDRLGGRLAASHLLEAHQRRRLIYLGGPLWAGPRSQRLEGVRDAVAAHPGTELVKQLPGQTSITSGTALANELLTSGISFDAVVCHSDVIAFSLCHALRQRGIPVPKAISVLGFDGLDQAAVFEPPITSVSAGPTRIGQQAAEWVVRAINGDQSDRRHVIDPSIQLRASCGCARP